MTLLEIDNLHLGLRTADGIVHALHGVTLHVDEGEMLAVVGESGCGKTVTMQTVLGLFSAREIAYRQGRIGFAGRDLLKLPEDEMRRLRGSQIAMVFQDPMTALNPTLTIGHQIGEAILAHRRVSRAAAMRQAVALLSQVGVPQPEMRAAQYPFQLSGGLRQRAVIASALACGPRLLIADEPTTALDVTIQAQILALLRSLQRQY
ncbi:MAG: ABC transporter ATP-binding protein, partial [bacterium]